VTANGLATRQPCRLAPDPSRVVTHLFVPGHTDLAMREGRAMGVVAHVLALDDDAIHQLLTELVGRFGKRHRDVLATFRHHAGRIGNRLPSTAVLSEERCLVLGAAFTHEYAVEAAALCNPSMVALPDQSEAPPGGLLFVMSVRQIGEGHRSSIGFRSGVVDASGAISVDERSMFTTAATAAPCDLDADSFRALDHDHPDDTEATHWVLDGLPDRFSAAALDSRLSALEAQRDTRHNVVETARRLRALGARTYTATFVEPGELGERVLYPATGVEANGMEDARFVRFVEDDGEVTYRATYTAFDGHELALQLLTTTDFVTFGVAPVLGAAAANKGLALFPRRIGGRYAALSRHDGATNSVAYSDDQRKWPTATPLVWAVEPWESVQVGNCGSPIETDAGWLVLTHGVGPMRTYSIGACLLDLDEPTRVIGRLHRPLLSPLPSEQDGYVPNVVYSCGGLVHDDTLVVPFGIGDRSIGFATASVAELLCEMT
jgi:predicted GH43/DUF377 family glycosyl hydrolase